MCDRWSTFPSGQGGPTGRCTRLSALGWGTAVPADQFGEQTYIKRGKGSGGMKGISTSPEQVDVCVCVNSFSVYNEAGEEQKPHGEVDGEEKNKHKEEGEGRRRLDEADRKKIAVELEKYSHPLNYQQPVVYNICPTPPHCCTSNCGHRGSGYQRSCYSCVIDVTQVLSCHC